jgi:hypothetical protein
MAIALLMAGMFLPAAGEAQMIVRTKTIAPGVVMVHSQPQRPSRHHIWVDGHYHYNARRNQYVWVDGHWARKRQNRKRRAVARHRTRCH